MNTFNQLCKWLESRNIKQILLFIGNGPGKQYKSIGAVGKKLDVALKEYLRTPLCVAFGGDTFVKEQPDLGAVVKEFKDRHPGTTVLSVQCWPEVDKHVDMVYKYEHIIYPEHKSLSWGGIHRGKLTGGTSVYLSDEWLRNDSFDCTLVDISAEGRVGKQEVEYAKQKNVDIVRVDAEPRFE